MAKFKPGKSGNPAGRPKGILDHRRRLAAGIDAGELVALALERARAGDMVALKMLLDRVLPPLRAEAAAVSVELEGSIAEQGRSVLAAIGRGELPPDLGAQILGAQLAHARLIELAEFEARIAALECAASD